MLKRLFDVIAATAGLVILLPLLIGIGLWVKLDSRGPVLFKHERVGRFGRAFRVWKFRTMVPNATSGPSLTVGRDPRITRAGHVLRQFKLDELPQLVNVLKGDMSLVGPRPEVARYVQHYPEDARTQILAVRPGITDPASLAFIDESTLLASSSDPERMYLERVLPEKIRLYVQYVATRSFWGDIVIIFRTLRASAGGSNG